MSDPTDIEMLAAALKVAGDNESSFQFYRHTYWMNVAAKILDAGYAVVKLPEMTVNNDEQLTWPLPDIDRYADVFVRRSDGRTGSNCVPTPLTVEHAEIYGAALIAAARHAQEENDA